MNVLVRVAFGGDYSDVREAMQRHYLPRFLASSFYQQLKQDLRQKESIHQVLQASEMVH